MNHVYVVNAFDTAKLEKVIKEATAMDEVAVIIAQAPCVLLERKIAKKQFRINPEVCMKCGMCMKPGCPAITKRDNGDIVINDTMCNGCGLCETLCKFKAIQPAELR